MNSFNWLNFEIEFLKSIIYNPKTSPNIKPRKIINDKDMLIPTIETIAPYPNKEFVIKYRDEIESKFLIRHPELIQKIYRDLSGYKASNYRGMLNELSKMKLGASLIGRYITAISDVGNPNYSYEASSIYASPVTINLDKSIANDVKLYDFQEEAIDKLKQDLIVKDKPNGMLVMPTGERVIIVMGAVCVIKSRVSGTLNKYISCIA